MQEQKMRFDGPDYVAKRDDTRLSVQFLRIFELMKDGKFRTLKDIEDKTGDPQASISAQLRHMRKERFGSHKVNKQHMGEGLYEYQLVLNIKSNF